MADWDRNANWDRAMLESIVALLFALAGLADLAADVSAPRRRQVLGILSWGEGEARAFVLGATMPGMLAAPDSADDAARLAASFRTLALAVCVLLAHAARSACAGKETIVQAGRQRLAQLAGRQATPLAPDTS